MEARSLLPPLKRLVSPTRHLHHSRLRRWDVSSESDYSDSSTVYKHTLKFQRPTTIKYKDHPINSASFIGTIAYPLKTIEARSGQLGFHTFLKLVNSSPSSPGSFMVMLKMWDEMAEISMQHLKLNDFVYVWGHLGSYTKADQNGCPRLLYKLDVKEINYVAGDDHAPIKADSGRVEMNDKSAVEKCRNKLHLWQVFLSSPHEWKDYRQSKINSRYPDFKHRDTGEALWIDPQDPPWIRRQLRLLDSKMVEQGLRDFGTSSPDLFPLVYDDTAKMSSMLEKIK